MQWVCCVPLILTCQENEKMKIANNILKYYLRNVRFITGTAYAGKSTMAAMLAKKYNLIYCGENYHASIPAEVLTAEQQPNLCYFKTKKDWQEFVNRTPEDYCNWIEGTAREAAEIEIAELIRRSQGGKIIVDTNIPLKDLAQIADYNQIAVMLSPQSMSVDNFFERDDPEKLFIKEQIMQAKNPEKTMENFKACLAKINSKKKYDQLAQSGFFTLVRKDTVSDTRQEVMQTLANHFQLTDNKNILISTERLYFRPFIQSDFEQFKELLVLYPGWLMQKDNVKGFFEWHLSNYKRMDIQKGYVCFGVFEKETNKLIGNVGLNEHDNLHLPELGYGILEAYRRRGYAKETAKGLLCWAKSYFDVPSLIGTAAVDNIASRKVLKYCGFTLQEVKNMKVRITNESCDFAVYQYVF